MSHSEAAEHIALRALLSELTHNLGAPLTPAWDKAYWAVPRHRFLPDRIRRTPDYAPIDRKDAPERWLWAAYSDEPAVIQLNDGDEPMNDDDRWPSSSASAPSLVFRVLDLLDVEDGHKVLEIGTGTGWNAG
ncbi:methyltransferase, partial [Streptomyces sp. LP05-1]|nr:methyltransferase [Streptomyces sp. LP05-1]